MEQKKIYAHELDDDEQEAENVIAVDKDMEEQNEVDNDFKSLQDMLQEDPYNVAVYQQIIEHYKRLNNSAMVQEIRKQAVENVNLTLDMWKDWIESEKVEATSFSDRVKINEVYEKALDSFNCTSNECHFIRLRYCQRIL